MGFLDASLQYHKAEHKAPTNAHDLEKYYHKKGVCKWHNDVQIRKTTFFGLCGSKIIPCYKCDERDRIDASRLALGPRPPPSVSHLPVCDVVIDVQGPGAPFESGGAGTASAFGGAAALPPFGGGGRVSQFGAATAAAPPPPSRPLLGGRLPR